MESLLNRYRNITVLLLVIFAQLVLLGYQVKTARDVRLIRIWAVSAVSPLARALETLRSGTAGFVSNYIRLHDVQEENRRIQRELDRVKMENLFLKNELSTAERAKALSAFQARTPSRTVAARIIGMGAGSNSKVVLVDRGSSAGVQKGMAVVTPDGIAGKVVAAYPTASQVLLVTDPDFAAGVISQKHHVRGTLKGQGYANCKVDYVATEEAVDVGEWFYTSGDDRVFPKGFPVGQVRVVRAGSPFKEIYVEPSGLQHGLEEVLILLEGVHQMIPEAPAANAPIYLNPPPPAPAETGEAPKAGLQTDADRLRERYKEIGDAQGHKFGEGLPGSKPPDFNLKLPAGQPAAVAPKPQAPNAAAPNTAAPKPVAPKPPAPKPPAPKPPPEPPQ